VSSRQKWHTAVEIDRKTTLASGSVLSRRLIAKYLLAGAAKISGIAKIDLLIAEFTN
jgi:hypothetical protein